MSREDRSSSVERILLAQSDSEDDVRGNTDEEEDYVVNMSEEPTDSEEDGSDFMEAETSCQENRAANARSRGRPTTRMTGKNGYIWNTKAPSRTSGRFSRISTYIPGPKNEAKNCNNDEEFFDVLLTRDTRDLIVRYTNIKIQQVIDAVVASGSLAQTYHKLTDTLEIDVFIGLLYYMGIWKASRVNVKDLWSNREGYNIYRSTMPCRRFIFLAECLRFDDVSNRTSTNRFSLIEEVWTAFIGNCQKNYNPHKSCTVDEQLLGFRGNCSFRVYIKSKPDKYGLKIVALNYAKTFYLINGVPYTGKMQLEKGVSVPSYVFEKVTEPIHGTNRSVTCDNWFTSFPLIEQMMEQPFDMTITGTVRMNKREVPLQMKIAGDEGSTQYAYHDSITLLSWTPKKKVVLVASSYGLDSKNGDSGKPIMVEHYKSTKGGTDTLDQLCHRYSVARGTKRWPMRFFFGILDQAVVNGRILYTCAQVNANPGKEHLSGREFQKKIAHHLLQPFLRQRLQQSVTLRTGIATSIKMILNEEVVQADREERPEFLKRVRCGLCTKSNDHKTKHQCPTCKRAMCDTHRMYLCVDCGKF